VARQSPWPASGLPRRLRKSSAVARHDPLHAADGAVRFLVKLSPALEQVDSSSGALGGAARAAVDALVPVIAQAPADGAMREKWLEQLFEAIQNDDPPYLELLDERWGDLCATPEVASRWADRVMRSRAAGPRRAASREARVHPVPSRPATARCSPQAGTTS
jgi:hypothetical protein